MSSCSHIDQVLSNESLKEGFLKAFNATKYIIQHSPAKNKYLNVMKCADCHQINEGTNFMCLQCGYCGCWNNSHFREHNLKVDHVFGVNSTNGLLYCFKCDDYIGDSELINASIIGKYWDDVSSKSCIPLMSKRDGLSGLVNMGSTCYVSCIIQCLVRNPYFLKYSLNQSHFKICKTHDPTTCISCALDSIVTDFYGISDLDDDVKKTNNDGLIDLLTCSWKINQNLAGYSQQDAHEFWQFLLNRLHSEYKSNIGPTDTAPLKEGNHELCNCIYHKVFQGFLKSSIVCPECNSDAKTTIEPFMDLSLDIKGKNTLYECLNSFHKKEQLHDFDYHCKNCNTSQDPTKQLAVAKLSPVLLFQFKRFEHLLSGSSIKLNDVIEFPLYLNMKDYCDVEQRDDSNSKPDLIYELIGIICHTGTVNEGHYTAICKIPEGQWIKFNDSMVTIISEETMLKEQAYLLIYTIKNIN
ncbi:hypothetical protein Kpol_1064p48 [Vanderwaltozyma polyspora DSM 70294]|uniref:Ubiquitin carboxyl-terminal hydrolase n=1 Tax=Vanderwaltozyma polyspora (strain ATCC 22028 / DSM 70294 / BCRC 21397 / CBS 2163 / NBRC 10782 / NRRL Y-8283 / UCD 57-17) TaxID=436907 RepID=A7TMH2_VANPO|nr:uncharacterized protein Kpol_1064p48 [Vanderwaltozyma polyspora DSM 70294]EDO16566.1 hypothetical protein Kpol_1064p48 [Vanderwaltozyma polyspora DSM 70294]